jgi:hypothetical protein
VNEFAFFWNYTDGHAFFLEVAKFDFKKPLVFAKGTSWPGVPES